VLGQFGERHRTVERHVVQELPLVLGQIRIVWLAERHPQPSVQDLELFGTSN
jgi:hypothetical protein